MLMLEEAGATQERKYENGRSLPHMRDVLGECF
jgi:hypothetical protein